MPYPEVFRKGGVLTDATGTRKRCVCAIVVCLNFLYLNRPKSCSSEHRISGPLNPSQWKAVRRLEHLCEAWFSVSPIGRKEMGLAAGKVETVSEHLYNLEALASSLLKDGQGYFAKNSIPVDKSGVEDLAQGLPIGVATNSGMSTFKPIDPARLSFVGKPSFDPTKYLDPISQEIFNNPLSTRTPPDKYLGAVPKLKVFCSRSQKIRLFELLDSCDRISFFRPDEVTEKFGSGLFSVCKDLERDRMILDSRGANLLEAPPQRWIRSLASGEALTRIVLEPSEQLLVSGNDLRDFYYLFKTTPSRARRNVLVGSVHSREVSHLKAVPRELANSGLLFGALNTLAMRDTQAVELAQSCHLSLALQHGVVTQDDLLTMKKPIPRSLSFSGLIIDDFINFAKVSWKTVPGTSPGASSSNKMLEVYRKVDLIPNEKKSFRDESNATFWGVDLDGSNGLIRGSLKRAVPLMGLILQLVQAGHCTGHLMQVICGSLISLFLYRRRFLSLLDPVFASYRRRDPQEIF